MKKLITIFALLMAIIAGAQLEEVVPADGVLINPKTSIELNALNNPVEGLLVTNSTTKSIWYYNGTEFIDLMAVISGGAPDWSTITNKPVLFDGTWSSLTGIPSDIADGDDDTIADGSETKIEDGTNTTVTGLGTVASPYQINATSSGNFVALDNSTNTIDTGDDTWGVNMDRLGITNSIRFITGQSILEAYLSDFSRSARVFTNSQGNALISINDGTVKNFNFDGNYDSATDVPTKSDIDAALSVIGATPQDLSLTGNTLNITGGEGVDLTPILEAATDSLKAPEITNFANVDVVIFGNSITAQSAPFRWVDTFDSVVNPKSIRNMAVSGQRITWDASTVETTTFGNDSDIDNRFWNSIKKWEADFPSDTPEAIIICLGTNDAPSPLGSYSAAYSQDVATTTHLTMAGAYRKALTYLVDNYPNAKIFYSTPLQSKSALRNFDKLTEISDINRAISHRLGVAVWETMKESGITDEMEGNAGIAGEDYYDGTHPNAKGAVKYGNYLASKFITGFSGTIGVNQGLAGGEINTASNTGSGVGLAQTKSGTDLPFKSIVAGTGISITENTNDITINSTATGTGGGDFLADGSVAMTGNLNLGGNEINNGTAQGATFGAELVVNGTFDTNVNDWPTNASGTATFNNGRLRVENSDGSGVGVAYQAVSLVGGTTYTVSADIPEINNTFGQLYLSTTTTHTNQVAGAFYNTPGTYSFEYTPPNNVSLWIVTGHRGDNSAGRYVEYDNISVRETIPATSVTPVVIGGGLNSTGNVIIDSLAGTGDRNVGVNAQGQLIELASSGSSNTSFTIPSNDLNNVTESGYMWVNGSQTNKPAQVGTDEGWVRSTSGTVPNDAVQYWYAYDDAKIYGRTKNRAVWGNWSEIGSGTSSITETERLNLRRDALPVATTTRTIDENDIVFVSGTDIGRKKLLTPSTSEETYTIDDSLPLGAVVRFMTPPSTTINIVPDTGITIEYIGKTTLGGVTMNTDYGFGFLTKVAANTYTFKAEIFSGYAVASANLYQETSAAGTGTGLGAWLVDGSATIASIADATSTTGNALEITGTTTAGAAYLPMDNTSVNGWSNGALPSGLVANTTYTMTGIIEVDSSSPQSYVTVNDGTLPIAQDNLTPKNTTYTQWTFTFTVPSGGMGVNAKFTLSPSINGVANKIRIHSLNIQ